ncbi:MAG: hypothetical protein WC586_12810 [Methanoregula sp.]
MLTDKIIPIALVGLILCGILLLGIYWAGHLSGASSIKDNFPQTGSVRPSATLPPDTVIITINRILDYSIGDHFTISGTTTLPPGNLLDIAVTKEPYHFTKCEPGTFCGFKTYSTIVSSGQGNNTWSLDLNTSGFTEGGYDIWVVARYSPNTSIHAGLNLKKS